MLPDFERADRIGEFQGNPKTRTFAELLTDPRMTGTYGRCSWGCPGSAAEDILMPRRVRRKLVHMDVDLWS